MYGLDRTSLNENTEVHSGLQGSPPCYPPAKNGYN